MDINKVKKVIEELEKEYDFNDYIMNYLEESDIEKAETADDVIELIEKANEDYNITDTEIIYYSNAMEYLAENDPSLLESLEIAKEYGYDTGSLNSELLASLLKSRKNLEDFNEFLERLKEELEK